MLNRPLGLFDIYINDGNYGELYPEKEEFSDQGIPFISASDFDGREFNYKNIKFITEGLHFGRLTKGHLKVGDVIIVVRGNGIGKVGYFKDEIGECNINAQLAFIRTNPDELDSQYLYYLLSSETYLRAMKKFGSGSAQPQLPINRLKLVPISAPHIRIQRKIGQTLAAIDQKIELNNRINAELEAMAKLIYDYWFVQFDFPDANGNPYKSSGGKMGYNEELKREIPESWSVDKLGALLDTALGGTPSTKVSEYWQGDTPWLDSGEVANFPIIESEKHISQDAIEKSATTLMPKGTCTLSITRHLRPSILAVDACANQSVVGIFESEELLNLYIYPYLQNEIPRFMSLRTGAQQPHINKGIVDSSLMVVPETRVLSMYYKKVASSYEKIYNNALENKQLQNLRDWLLPMLMNGQVTISTR